MGLHPKNPGSCSCWISNDAENVRLNYCCFIFVFRGLVLCVGSGLLYSQTFTAATYVQDNYEGASQNGTSSKIHRESYMRFY